MMKSYSTKYLSFLFLMISTFAGLGQSNIFRLPYFSYASPQFNPALAGSSGKLKGGVFGTTTVFPSGRFVAGAGIDGQIPRKPTPTTKGFVLPRAFPTAYLGHHKLGFRIFDGEEVYTFV